jgi:hypothetical protein
LININLREKTSQKYKAVHFDPKKKKSLTATVRNDSVQKGDTLKITTRCTSKKQALVQAQAVLHRSDTKISGSLEFVGNPNLIAGLNIELKGIGHFQVNIISLLFAMCLIELWVIKHIARLNRVKIWHCF